MTKSKLMKTFIRVDQVGHWTGTEHELLGVSGGVYFEDDISCYEFDGEGIANLYNSWRLFVGLKGVDIIENMQVIIFKGELVGYGTYNECLATCTETVKEFPARILFDKWMEMNQRWFDDEETTANNEKEYLIEHAQEMIDFINTQ